MMGDDASANATTWIRLRGFPWEADAAAVLRAVLPQMAVHGEAAASGSGADAASPHDCFLPLDARARPSGDALLRIDTTTADALVRALDGHRVDGGRYLQATLSSEAEVAEARERSAQAASKAQALAPQAFNQTRARSERPAPPEDRREIVVLCHGAPDAVARGAFELNNLPEGRVDLLARCASSALFYSHGVRRGVRLWLVLSGHGRTLCCDGGAARGLRPDERSLAVAMRRAIKAADHAARQRTAAATGAAGPVVETAVREAAPGAAAEAASLPAASHDGWSVVDGDTLEGLLRRLRGERALEGCGETAASVPALRPLPLLQLHEEGEPLPAVLERLLQPQQRPPDEQMQAQPHQQAEDQAREHVPPHEQPQGCVLVAGDHLGYTPDDEAALQRLGAVRCSLGHVPLLTSHCIVLSHHWLDAAHRPPSGPAAST